MALRWDTSLMCFAVIVQVAKTVPMDTTTTYVTTATTADDASQTTTDGLIMTTTDIGVCYTNPCMYGDCTSNGTGYVCSCWPGAMGVNCDELDECYTNPCFHRCPVSPDRCSCFIGWTGSNCEDIGECWPRSCVNGYCYGDGRGTMCSCEPGWTGTFCEVGYETTTTEPTTTTELIYGVGYETTTTEPTTTTELIYGDTYCFLMEPCVHGDCVDVDIGYECHCWPGWTGTDCEVADETTTTEPTTELFTHDTLCFIMEPCVHGDCVDINVAYECHCYPGWSGTNCEVADETTTPEPTTTTELIIADTYCFLMDPCVNGDCVDLDIGYECHCYPGWTGTNCEVADETTTVEPTTTTELITSEYVNECESEPCVHGLCTDLNNGYLCTCRPGWTGANCDERQVSDHGCDGHQRGPKHN